MKYNSVPFSSIDAWNDLGKEEGHERNPCALKAKLTNNSQDMTTQD